MFLYSGEESPGSYHFFNGQKQPRSRILSELDPDGKIPSVLSAAPHFLCSDSVSLNSSAAFYFMHMMTSDYPDPINKQKYFLRSCFFLHLTRPAAGWGEFSMVLTTPTFQPGWAAIWTVLVATFSLLVRLLSASFRRKQYSQILKCYSHALFQVLVFPYILWAAAKWTHYPWPWECRAFGVGLLITVCDLTSSVECTPSAAFWLVQFIAT